MDEALESLAHEVVFAYDDINPTFSIDEREFLYEAAEKDVDSFFAACHLVFGMRYLDVFRKVLNTNDELIPKLLEAAQDPFFTSTERKIAAENLNEIALALALMKRVAQEKMPELEEECNQLAIMAENSAIVVSHLL